ncbi:MAG TPA: carbonate dehydratase [Polyangiaceae bacterium]|nr:carbonate dehydratase [Polyangiaceae bacterium]
MRARDPGFFARLRDQQRPDLLWIGCSDSRLPPDRILGLQPGELFVHRNVGNLVVHTDLNCLSVLEYGIEVLGVRHVIVCGHYGCGGVLASLQPRPLGAMDGWLRHLRDVQLFHRAELEGIAALGPRADRLCELNVVAQVANVCRTTPVQEAWRRGRPLAVHGWIYSLSDGMLRDLDVTAARAEQLPERYRLPGAAPAPRPTAGGRAAPARSPRARQG